MILTRRMIAVGLPAAGATVFAALALSGATATAAPGDTAGHRPAVMTTPCAGDRAKCVGHHGYGATGAPAGGPSTTHPVKPTATHTSTPTATSTGNSAGAGTPVHTRGHGGYGSIGPSTTPTTTPTTKPTTPTTKPTTPAPGTSTSGKPTPTGNTDTVPPGGVSPSSAGPGTSPTPGPGMTTHGGGVSAGSALPVTGAPMGAVISLGTLMVAAGAGTIWYTRRRRTA